MLHLGILEPAIIAACCSSLTCLALVVVGLVFLIQKEK